MDNLELWNKVQKTDPAHVKAITGKSYGGTSPKPHYLVMKATETFGPIGIGWGFNIVEERIEDTGTGRLSIARVRVWYKWAGERGEVEHIGGTEFSGVRSSGKAFADEDAPKKSVTDALVKALSMIGFAGDIFMGRYDDSKYVAELVEEKKAAAREAEESTESADTTAEADARAKMLVEEWLRKIADAKDPAALRDWWGSEERKRMTTDFELTQAELDAVKGPLGRRIRELDATLHGRAAA